MPKFPIDKDIFINRELYKQPEHQRYYTVARWNEARQNAGLPRVNPPNHAEWTQPVTHKPRYGADNKSISYIEAFPPRPGELTNIPNYVAGASKRPANQPGGFKKARTDNIDSSAGPSNRTVVVPSTTQSTPISTTMKTRSQGPPSAAGGLSSNSDNTDEIMEAMDGSSSVSVPSEAPSMSGHNASSEGGFDSAQGPLSMLSSPSYKMKHGYMSFTKVHRLRLFAIPITKMAEQEGSDVTFIATPMAYIPVDKIYFYMSEREFNLIPHGSYIEDCHATVNILNASTSFETGASTSDTATNTHLKAGLIGLDLDKKFRGGQVNTLQIAASMIPTLDTEGEDMDDFVKYQYGSWPFNPDVNNSWDNSELPGYAYGIQYNKYDYFCMYQMNQAGYTADGWVQGTSVGHEIFQSGVTEFNINDKLWDRIVNYHYKFNSAPIGGRYHVAELKSGAFTQSLGQADDYRIQRTVTGVNGVGQVTFASAFVPSSYTNVNYVLYNNSCIEKGAANQKGSTAFSPKRQPTLYIGMRAIPKTTGNINSKRSDTFVNADMTIEVTATINVRVADYPNRFTQPGRFTVNIENAETGTGAGTDDPLTGVSFGLKHDG